MKKKLAALLCGVMCAASLSGCSEAELGYLKMSSDIMSQMPQSKTVGQVQMDVDFDLLGDYVADAYGERGIFAEPLAIEKMSGKKAATFDYTLQADMDQMKMYLDLGMKHEGRTYDMGDIYYSQTEGVYVSTQTIWGLYEASQIVAGDYNGYFYGDAFAKDLKAAVSKNQYVQVLSAEEMAESAVMGASNGMNDAVVSFFKEAFNGLSSGLVKEVSGGYQIQASGRDAAQLVINTLDYLVRNTDQVLTAFENYTVATAQAEGATSEDVAAIREGFAGMKASKGELAGAINEFNVAVKDAVATKNVGAALDGFAYDSTIKKAGSGYSATSNYTVTYGGKQAMKITAQDTMQKAAFTATCPANSCTFTDLSARMTAVNDRHNPIKGVVMEWGWEATQTEARLTVERAKEAPFGLTGESQDTSMVLKDNRAYLPLRAIVEALGENVTWNQEQRTAYVAVNGQNIPMKGLIKDDRSYVGVRDFEKLGYTVTYTQNNARSLKEAAIMK